MLPVKSGLIVRTITQERVSGVARGAVEKVLHKKEDHSQYMGPVDSFLDIFCDGVKKTAIKRINGISRHTAKLFKELEKPEPDRSPELIKLEVNKIDQNRQELSKIAFGKTLEFGHSGGLPSVDERSFLVCRDPDQIAPLGIALYPSKEPKIDTEGIHIGPIIPAFETTAHISVQDLARLRISQRIKCRNKEYIVRFTGLYEPILLHHCSDLFAKSVQTKLSTLWVLEQANRSSEDLHLIGTQLNTPLEFPSLFPEPKPGEIRTAEQLAIIRDWRIAADLAAQNVQIMAQRLKDELITDQAQLIQALNSLVEERVSIDAQRSLLLNTNREIDAFKEKQTAFTTELDQLKKNYLDLYSLAEKCELTEMRSILLARFNNFNNHFSQYNEFHAEEDQQQRFLAVQNTETEFLGKFNAIQLLNCLNLLDPSPTAIKPSIILRPPKSLRERAQLVALLRNPEATWARIRSVMENLRSVQNSFISAQTLRHELIDAIDMILRVIKGKNGLCLDSGVEKTFYKPETFSRIISIIEERTELLDPRQNFSMAMLVYKDTIIDGHFFLIDQETQKIDENLKVFGATIFRKPKMYIPQQINGKFMSHLQWNNYQRLKEPELLKTSA